MNGWDSSISTHTHPGVMGSCMLVMPWPPWAMAHRGRQPAAVLTSILVSAIVLQGLHMADAAKEGLSLLFMGCKAVGMLRAVCLHLLQICLPLLACIKLLIKTMLNQCVLLVWPAATDAVVGCHTFMKKATDFQPDRCDDVAYLGCHPIKLQTSHTKLTCCYPCMGRFNLTRGV